MHFSPWPCVTTDRQGWRLTCNKTPSPLHVTINHILCLQSIKYPHIQPRSPSAFIPKCPSLCSGGGNAFKVPPSHFFKRHTGQFIHQGTAAINDRRSSTIYWQVVDGAEGLGAESEVSAGPVKDYKALVVAHDLFMADWDTVVWGSWSLLDSTLLLHWQKDELVHGKRKKRASGAVNARMASYMYPDLCQEVQAEPMKGACLVCLFSWIA